MDRVEDPLDVLTFAVVDGRVVWSDGTVLPVVSGGSDDGDTGSGTGEGAGVGDGADEGNSTGEGQGESEGKTFTQADIDRIVQKRLAKAERDWKTQVEEAANRAKMDEAERLKAEKADSERAATEAQREALAARVETAGVRLALAADIDPARVDRFVELAKLADDIDAVTDNGRPDDEAIKATITETLKKWPEFKTPAAGQQGRSAGEMNGHHGTTRPATLEAAFASKMR